MPFGIVGIFNPLGLPIQSQMRATQQQQLFTLFQSNYGSTSQQVRDDEAPRRRMIDLAPVADIREPVVIGLVLDLESE